jgi:hypothetical protein
MLNQLEDNKSYLGFTDEKPALQKGKIEKCLDKAFRYIGGERSNIMARKDAMIFYLREGRKPEIREERNNGNVRDIYVLAAESYFMEITKTEYDFCLYLIEHDLISEESVNAYINAEQKAKQEAEEAARLAEETAKKEKERKEQEKVDFKRWLAGNAKMYAGTTYGNLQERIFYSIYNEFRFPEKSYELLVCINNIDMPLCREELKNRLHINNKASRKTFYCMTGLKLPRTNKETMEFLDKVQKSDYLGMVEYKERKRREEKPKPEEKPFYMLIIKRDGKENVNKFVKVIGEPLTYKGIDLFVHESEYGYYRVSSVECGVMLIEKETKQGVIKAAKAMINKTGVDSIKAKIKDCIELFGAAPLKTV